MSASAVDPGRPLLVFDGDCGFCTSSARLGQRWLHLDHVEPWQHLDLDALDLTEQQCRDAVQWVDTDGRTYAAERAVARALVAGGRWWRPLGHLLSVPGIRHLAGAVYRLVARHRHRLPGGTPACRLPDPTN